MSILFRKSSSPGTTLSSNRRATWGAERGFLKYRIEKPKETDVGLI
jgi:hypothetical protein